MLAHRLGFYSVPQGSASVGLPGTTSIAIDRLSLHGPYFLIQVPLSGTTAHNLSLVQLNALSDEGLVGCLESPGVSWPS